VPPQPVIVDAAVILIHPYVQVIPSVMVAAHGGVALDFPVSLMCSQCLPEVLLKADRVKAIATTTPLVVLTLYPQYFNRSSVDTKEYAHILLVGGAGTLRSPQFITRHFVPSVRRAELSVCQMLETTFFSHSISPSPRWKPQPRCRIPQ